MRNRIWTLRGEMQGIDRAVIVIMAAKNPVAARIFVTGEVDARYIGEAAVRALIAVNDTLYENGVGGEPLFVETVSDTVRMTRFDPKLVWRCLEPEVLAGLVAAEAERLHLTGFDAWHMDNFDFYQEMAAVISRDVGAAVPRISTDSDLQTHYTAVYLSCLILFNKPGYLAIPVAEYFARRDTALFMKDREYRALNLVEREKLTELKKRYGGIGTLTNPELDFVVSLYGAR